MLKLERRHLRLARRAEIWDAGLTSPLMRAHAWLKEACERLQLDLHKVSIRARQAPRKKALLELIDLLASLNYPVLIHCKSGADRTGFVTAVYLIAIERRPVNVALDQLALRFGHLRFSRAGILREVIEDFGRHRDAVGLDFRSWVETRYVADEVALRFRA